MTNKEIIKSSKEVITKARQIESMLKSAGWKHYQAIKEKKKQELIDNMFKSEMTVKKHEYNRGAVNFVKDIEEELKGSVDDADNAQNAIDELNNE